MNRLPNHEVVDSIFSLTLIGSGAAVGYVALNSDGRDTGCRLPPAKGPVVIPCVLPAPLPLSCSLPRCTTQ